MERTKLAVYTEFGTVTESQIQYLVRSGPFGLGGKSQLDIPIRHVVAVSASSERHIVGGLIATVLGLWALVAGDSFPIEGGLGSLIGLLLIAVAGLMFWGSAAVTVYFGGQKIASGALPWQKPDAARFANAVRDELFAASRG